MSREFTAVTDRITQGTVALPVIGSLAFWIYPTWAQTDGVDHVFFDQRPAGGANLFTMQHYSDNTLYLGWKITTDYRVVITTANYTLNQNAWNLMVLTWDDTANVSKAYLNGAQIGSSTSTLVTTSLTGSLRYIGNYSTATASGDKDCRSRIAEFAIWDAVLTAAEVLSLNAKVAPTFVRPASITDYLPLYGKASPEQNLFGGTAATIASGTAAADHAPMYYPTTHEIFTPGAAVTAYELDLAAGTYTHTGADLGTLAGRALDLAAGGYTHTGAVLGTLAGRALNLQSGAYAHTGADLLFARGFVLNLDAGIYQITGAALSPLAGRVIDLGAGSYLVNGAALTPLAGRALNLDPGVYQVTGAGLIPLAGRTIDLQAGSYVINGQDLILVKTGIATAYSLSLDPGTYLLIGANLSALAGRVLNLEPGVYTLIGAQLTALAARQLNLDPGVYNLTGSQLSVLAGRMLNLAPGVYTLTAAQMTMLGAHGLHLEPGVYLLEGSELIPLWSGATPGAGSSANVAFRRRRRTDEFIP